MADTDGSADRRKARVARALRSPAIAASAAVSLIAAAVVLPLLSPPRPLLVWNASGSTARGLYLVMRRAPLRAGDTVVASPPPWARNLAAARAYLSANVPLVKPVAAVSGDRICAAASRIFVNGRAVAVRRARDPHGRLMPWWNGCRVLHPGELFLLSAAVPDAFDGRYFGVTRKAELIGKARLLWAR